MALYKRSGIWWVDIRHKGKRIRQSTGTKVKTDAQRLHDQLKHETWSNERFDSKPQRSWCEAVIRWLEESQHKKSLETDKMHLAWLDQYLRGKMLYEIDQWLIEQIAKEKEQLNVKPATVNRVLEMIRAILNKAHKDWEWLDTVPVIRMRKVENKRVRWLTSSQAKRLLTELPEHLQKMAAFTLATGLRESNVTKLKWQNIDLKRNHALVHPEDSKSSKAIPVPLNKTALDILSQCKGHHKEYVFTYMGRPVSRCNNHAWRKALKRAGIENFRWHDLRHTWASWHVQNGTSLQELQQLGGWSSFEMVLRYAHLSSDHLKLAASRICDTIWPQKKI